MIKVFKLELEIIRERFKIYGFFNILTLTILFAAIIGGVKFFQFNIGHYMESTLLIIAMMQILFSKYIFPNNYEKKFMKIKTYFNSFDINDIKKYFMYKNLTFFYIVIFYLVFPTHINEIGMFSFYFMIINILLFIQICFKNKLNENKYLLYSTYLNIFVGGVLLLYMKKLIDIPIDKIINIYTSVVFILISIYLIIKNFKYINIGGKNKEVIYFEKFSKRIFKVIKNRDLIFAIRRNLFIEPIFAIIVTNILFKNSTNNFDLILGCTLSIVCSFIALYIKLLKSEKGKFIYFYGPLELKKLRLYKCLNTILICLIVLILIFTLLMFLIPIKIIIISYIISIAIIFLSINMVKINAEKYKGITKIITDKEIIYLYIVSILVTIVFTNIANIVLI